MKTYVVNVDGYACFQPAYQLAAKLYAKSIGAIFVYSKYDIKDKMDFKLIEVNGADLYLREGYDKKISTEDIRKERERREKSLHNPWLGSFFI